MTQLITDSIMITGFVAAMMLLIECLNVVTGGRWVKWLGRGRTTQYLLSALLGVAPGCLGAFTAVALYSHGLVSFGAVTAAMIAASGDEAFVMLALVPAAAVKLAAIMFGIAVCAGYLIDLLAEKRGITWPKCGALVLHDQERPSWPSCGEVITLWKDCSAARGVLTVSLALFALAIAAGRLGPGEWNWIRVSLIAVSSAAFLVAATAPEHFLEEHLWRHVIRKHAPRVFLWTLAALALSGPLEQMFRLGGNAQGSLWILLVMACVMGLIPESGPHLIFVTLYAQNALPFSILLASSIVQDGHGMLPMLAHSRRAFFTVKGLNFLLGMMAGGLGLVMGF